MPVVISMLRAVNLGSHNRIKMEALRAVYESLEFTDVKTYVQSGNVIFRARSRGLDAMNRQVQDAIEEAFGFRPDVIARTTAEMKAVVAKNPFANRDGVEPGKLLVTFLSGDPGPEANEKLSSIKTDPEELYLQGRELYIYYPNGAGRSKLPSGAIEKALKVPGTARNWNSVTKMLEIAENLESAR